MNYYAEHYAAMRRNLVPHATRITADNIDELNGIDFVFLTMDAGPAKRTIVDAFTGWRQALRVTAAVPGHYDHLARRISYTDVEADEYDWNIQTADLNMLNAALAVHKWKKLSGYYVDRKQELNETFVVASNALINGGTPE